MSYLILFIIIIFFILFIIGIAIILSFYGESLEKSALEGNFFLRSLGNPFDIVTYMFNNSEGKILSINDSTQSCDNFSWSLNNKKIESKAGKGGGVIYVSSSVTNGPVSIGNPGSTDLSDWQYDFNSQSFCLVGSSRCLYNNNGVVEIKDFGIGEIGFGWVPESKTTDKICS